jgi:hypothetical protein
MNVHRPSLGRPARDFKPGQLAAEHGKGDSLTCFANHALFYWNENIPGPTQTTRQNRRELICILANSSYLHPLTMMAIVLLKKREARPPERRKRHPNYS